MSELWIDILFDAKRNATAPKKLFVTNVLVARKSRHTTKYTNRNNPAFWQTRKSDKRTKPLASTIYRQLVKIYKKHQAISPICIHPIWFTYKMWEMERRSSAYACVCVCIYTYNTHWLVDWLQTSSTLVRSNSRFFSLFLSLYSLRLFIRISSHYDTHLYTRARSISRCIAKSLGGICSCQRVFVQNFNGMKFTTCYYYVHRNQIRRPSGQCIAVLIRMCWLIFGAKSSETNGVCGGVQR